MRLLFYFICVWWCLSGSVALADDFKFLLQQARQPLLEEIIRRDKLPVSLLPPQAMEIKLTSRLKYAVAEYRQDRKTVYLSRKILKQWLKRINASAAEPQTAVLLAQCLAPVYAHELSHARDQRQAAVYGFAWPVTLDDEVIASLWQLYVLWTYDSAPDYKQTCREFLPVQKIMDAQASQRKETIYQVYARATDGQLPPPMTLRHIRLLAQKGQINFAGQNYQPKHRKKTLDSLRKRGGNWTLLSKTALSALETSLYYQHYKNLQNQHWSEIDLALM